MINKKTKTIPEAVIEKPSKEVAKKNLNNGTVSGCDSLWIRSEAVVADNTLASLMVNETVEVIGEDGDFYKVNYNGLTGYCMKKYIKKN